MVCSVIRPWPGWCVGLIVVATAEESSALEGVLKVESHCPPHTPTGMTRWVLGQAGLGYAQWNENIVHQENQKVR